jgi:biotin synthase
MTSLFDTLADRAIATRDISEEDALELYQAGKKDPFGLMARGSRIREHFKGDAVNLCGIVNAKSGVCPENCRFCAQSAHYHTDAPVYPLMSADEIAAKGRTAKESGAHMFSIVTSGTRIETEAEWETIYRAIAMLSEMGLKPCGSLGMLSEETARNLKKAGLYRYHHNLETSRSFFDSICSTHEYHEDTDTVGIARAAGLTVCSGGIIGLGEAMEHRIEMAMTLRELDVDSVPINILNAIPGTPLENVPALTPIEILLTVALYRFILPDKDIKLCGGKEKNLRQLLPLAMVAGCNSLLTGNYLTTLGRDTAADLEMIHDLGMVAKFDEA